MDMYTVVAFTILQVVFAGFLGSFRGGEILPTGHTQIARGAWAFFTAIMLMGHGWTILPTLSLAVAMFVSEWMLPHTPFQGMQAVDDDWGMIGIGVAHGLICGLAVCYWEGIRYVVFLPLLWGVSQFLAYFIGYRIPFTYKTILTNFAPGTPTAEFIANMLVFASLVAVKFVTL